MSNPQHFALSQQKNSGDPVSETPKSPLLGLHQHSVHPAIDSGEVGMVLQLVDGTVQACNPAAEKILGYTLAQIQECSYIHCPWQTIHPDGSPFPEESHPSAVALQTGKPIVDEVMGFYQPNGQLIWLQVNAQPLFLRDGKTLWAVCTTFTSIAQPISNSQSSTSDSSNRDLRRSETLFRRLAEVSVFGVAIGDLSGRMLYANDSLLKMIGYSRQELEADQIRWVDLTPPEYLHLDWHAAEEMRQHGVATPFEKEYIHKDGHRIPILIGGALLDEPDLEQPLVTVFYLDMTRFKQAEELLRQSEERFRLAASAVAGMVYDWNVQTGEVYRSEGVYQLLGVHSEAIPRNSDSWAERMHPDDCQRVEQHWQTILSGQSDSYEVEYRIRHQNGNWVHVCDRGYVIRDRQGQVIRVVGSVTDITARKQIEQEREQLLQREQAAREQAEAVSRLKDEFLAAVSHELRTPLTPILGWSRLLQTRQFKPEKVAQVLAIIERNAKLQAQLIEDLLDVSRVIQGRLTLHRVPVGLAAVITAALHAVKPAAEAKSITVETSLDSTLPPILGDPMRLQQVMWNLLSNAIKYTPAGGQVEVELSLAVKNELWVKPDQPMTNDNLQVFRYAEITVRDTGVGIPPEFLPYVFEHFRQQDGATTRKVGGLGLGLAIVKQIVELHGGTIDAESAGIGQGATFVVKSPLLKKEGGKEPESSSDSTSPLSTIDSLAGLHILVVEDEADSRDYLSFLLEQEQARVTVAESALEALEILSQHQPDILLSDIGMPHMNGYEFMQQVRQQLRLSEKRLPAIALTAYTGEYIQQEAIGAGFQQHLAKPVEPDELVRAIASLIPTRSPRPTPTQ